MKKLFDKTKHIKYYITDKGELLSKSIEDGTFRTKKPNRCKRGYLYARTPSGNYQIHRLVANAFIKNIGNKPHVNHKDFNKHNNQVSNLEWVTPKENYQHSALHGRMKLTPKNGGGNIKYTNKQCKEIMDLVKTGMTYKMAGQKYNMPYSTVAHLMRGSRREI